MELIVVCTHIVSVNLVLKVAARYVISKIMLQN